MTLFIFNYSTVFSIVLVLMIISFFLSAGLMIYSLRIHSNKAANAFGILMLVISIWVMFKIISLFVSETEIREFLHKINVLLIALITPLLLIVSMFHTNIPSWFKTKHIRWLFIFPGIIYLMVFISSYKNFLFYDFEIIHNFGIPIHIFKKKFVYLLLDIYDYLLIFSALIILLKSLSSKQKYFRRQMSLFVIGLLIPILYDSLYILGISPIKNYNLSPVFISFGNCFLAWSMFGYRFLKIVPVARNLVVDNMPDIMLIISNENYIIDMNKSGENLFGLKKEEIVGENFTTVFHSYPELIEKCSNHNGKAEISIVHDNQTKWYSVTFSPLGNDKNALATIILLHDITGILNTEKHIKKLSVAIEQSPITIVITDISGNIEYVNPAFSITTGYTSEEAFGNNPRVLKGLTPENTFVELWKTINSGKVWKGEFINRKKSGEYYYEEATIAPVKNNKDEIVSYIAIKSDISQQKEAEKKIQLQNEELKELIATKDKFFSIIAHDLRSPFNAILGYSDYLTNNSEELEKEQVRLFSNYINVAANQTLILLENLLEWSRISRGLVKPNLEKINLKVLADEIETFNTDIAKNKSITIQNEIKSASYILCDNEMIKTVLRNLVSNAIKFSGENGIVTISAASVENFIEILIKDSGIGISQERIPNLFSIEKNTTTVGTANEKGTGLGLPLCKELIELQGGKIRVESEIGLGSLFILTMPLA